MEFDFPSVENRLSSQTSAFAILSVIALGTGWKRIGVVVETNHLSAVFADIRPFARLFACSWHECLLFFKELTNRTNDLCFITNY